MTQRHPSRPPVVGRGVRRLAALVAALVLSLTLAELLLSALQLPSERAFHFLGPLDRDRDMVADARTFWRLDPQAERFHANRLQLRGWLPRGEKLASDVRIAVVGDSCTFGSGVAFEESYGARLERSLQAALPERRVETICAAIPGYSSHQSRLLYTGEVVGLRPDVSVFYLGAFNDYQDANGLSDAERTALRERPVRRALGKLRLGRLLLRLDDPELDPANQAKVPGRRRVPLELFRANLEALVDAARAADSLPLLIVPPLPRETLDHYPVALEYRAAVHAVAAERGVALVDAPELFAPHAVTLPPDWPPHSRRWPLYVDSVHPSAFGHELLAAALMEHLGPSIAAWHARPRPTAAAPTLAAPDPPALCAFDGAELVLRGTGLDARSFDRLFVGDVWIPEATLEPTHDAGVLRVPLPRYLQPGTWPVTLVTRAGLVRAPGALEVLPPALPLEATLVEGGLQLSGELHGPPGGFVQLYAATRLREAPAPTRAGPFWLAADPDGRLPGIDDGPFVFERLQLASAGGALGPAGRWRMQGAPYPLRGDEQAVFAQAIFYLDGARCVLSAPLRLEVAGTRSGG